MKHLFHTLLLALFLCAAPAQAQTLKSLMFNSTNGQVVANTGTNVLTFVSTTNQSFLPVKFRDWNTGQEMQIVLSDESLVGGYTAVRGSIGSGGGDFQIKYGLGDADWGNPLLFAFIGDGVWQTVSPATTTNDSYRFNHPISFNNTTNTAATRANLGLGATNDVTFSTVDAGGLRVVIGTNIYLNFTDDGWESSVDGRFDASVTVVGDLQIRNDFPSGTSSNGLLYIRRTNNEPFLGLANLIASNNTTISNETLFRVGVAEATNQSAQFGFRSTNTNGSGVAVFSVFGYNALMMVGADASTNAVIFSGGGTNNEVMTLIKSGATEFARPISFSTTAHAAATRTNLALGATSDPTFRDVSVRDLSIVGGSGGKIVYPSTNTAPANTSNVVTWIQVNVGTNSYRVPLYQ
jgi:hypothetical protein